MSEDTLRYDKMVENALRGVVRQALEVTVRNGLFGDHHFYITFRTHAAGVQIPPDVLARHPDEMTIVLQHQFWDLEVDEHGFSVTLSFSGASKRLNVPYAAITGFADPSAKFGLQFQVDGDDADADEGSLAVEVAEAEEPAAAEPAPATDTSGKVVALDAFRKK